MLSRSQHPHDAYHACCHERDNLLSRKCFWPLCCHECDTLLPRNHVVTVTPIQFTSLSPLLFFSFSLTSPPNFKTPSLNTFTTFFILHHIIPKTILYKKNSSPFPFSFFSTYQSKWRRTNIKKCNLEILFSELKIVTINGNSLFVSSNAVSHLPDTQISIAYKNWDYIKECNGCLGYPI